MLGCKSVSCRERESAMAGVSWSGATHEGAGGSGTTELRVCLRGLPSLGNAQDA